LSQAGEQPVTTQVRIWHCSLAKQAWSQVLQWSWLERRSKQPPATVDALEQHVSLSRHARPAPGQLQLPDMQRSPRLQAWPQTPQLAMSLVVSTQAPPQQVWPVVQTDVPH
jgi:hypothetical protein